MVKTIFTVILVLVILAMPANSQAPASTDGEISVSNYAIQSEERLVPEVEVFKSSFQPTGDQNDDLELIIPFASPSVHTDYFGFLPGPPVQRTSLQGRSPSGVEPGSVKDISPEGDGTAYVWRGINSGKYHAYGVEDGRFVYQPGDTWFVYGIFGPIEATKYDWNVKYTNWNGWHNGLDFAAPIGTPVVSASGGEVIFVGERAGHTIVVQTSNFQITYSHLNSFTVKVGERVSQGQLIGYTGSSGTPNPHLHFQIDKYENGQRWGINPMKYLLPELQSAIMPDVPTNRYMNGEPYHYYLTGEIHW